MLNTKEKNEKMVSGMGFGSTGMGVSQKMKYKKTKTTLKKVIKD